MAEQDDKWRDNMPREDRVKVCQHIMAKLGSYYPNTPDRLLKHKTSTFESGAFNKAKSRRDYLEKIADGLSKVENSIGQQTRQAVGMPNMHPAAAAAAASANPQAHPLYGQSIQQQQAQQARLQQHQLMQQQQQYQQELRTRQQIVLQRQQQQQQQPLQQRPQAQQPQQQQQQPGVKQEHARKAAGQQKRPIAVPDGKKKQATPSLAKNPPSAANNAAAAIAARAKSQALSHSNSADAEALQRKAQMSTNQPMSSAAQPALPGGIPNTDYFFKPQEASGSQNAPQLPGRSHGQTTPNAVHGSGQLAAQVPQMNLSQQPMAARQGQGQVQGKQQGRDAQSAALSHHSLRQAQGNQQQNLGSLNSGATSATVMDSTTNTAEEKRKNILLSALMASASASGIRFTQEQIRRLKPEEIRRLLSHASQQGAAGVNYSNNANMPIGAASGAQNVANWMGQFPNAAAGRAGAGQVPGGVGQSSALAQAQILERHKQLQQKARQHQMHQIVQMAVPDAQGKAGSLHAASAALQAGLTGPQITAFVAQQAKIDHGTPEEKRAAIAEAMKVVSRARGSQTIQNPGQIPMRTGGLPSDANSRGIPQPSVSAGVQQNAAAIGSSNAHSNPANARNGTDEEFWTKLDQMKARYKPTLKNLIPVIQRSYERQPAQKRQMFMKQLSDCYEILNLPRSQEIDPKLTTHVLLKAEEFIERVIRVYSNYLKGFTTAASADAAKRASLASNQVERAKGAAQAAHASSGGPSTAVPHGSRVPLRGTGAHGKTEAGPAHIDPQQYILQQAQMQQKHKEDLLTRTHLQGRQAQAAKQQTPQTGQQQALQGVQVSAGQQGAQQPGNAMFSQGLQLQAQQRRVQGQVPTGVPVESAKSGKAIMAKVAAAKVRVGGQKGRQPMGAPRPAGSIAQNPTQAQARTHAEVEAQVQRQVAQAHAQARAQAQAAASVHAHAAQAQVAQAQVAQAQAAQAQGQLPGQAQAHAQALAQSQLNGQQLQQMRQQASNRLQVNRNQKVQMRTSASQHRLPPQGAMASNLKQQGVNGMVPGWPAGQSSMISNAGMNQVPSAGRGKRELTLQQHLQAMQAAVKEAVTSTHMLERHMEKEMKRAKNERIQNTLAAIRNNSSAKAADAGKSSKRPSSLVDVDNFGNKSSMIKSKAVFECSSEDGLRLAKRPKNEAQDLKSLREAVEADCKAAKERNPLLMIKIIEEFGQPVVTCLLRIMEIRLPKLVLRVQRGYPRKGGATYGFERPPMGWVGVLKEIRERFKRALATSPAASVGVAAFLDAWAREADAVINGSHLSENR